MTIQEILDQFVSKLKEPSNRDSMSLIVKQIWADGFDKGFADGLEAGILAGATSTLKVLQEEIENG